MTGFICLIAQFYNYKFLPLATEIHCVQLNYNVCAIELQCMCN